jgi:C4-dicarboxylate transporter DctM subunit
VVSGATIGTVIPPSVGYILYGVITNESIGQLFMAGLIPGAIIFGCYCLYVILLGTVSRQRLFEARTVPVQSRKTERPGPGEILSRIKDALWGILAPIFVLGGIYIGVFTPSEAAAVMVVYAVLVTAVLMRTLTLKEFFRSVLVGAEISSMILLIIVGARIFGAVTSQMRMAADLVSFVNEAGISPYGTLALVAITMLVFGMFLDSASIMVITLPIFYPLMMANGFNSVWFGVFFIVMLEVGLLTPPVGLNIFLIYGISKFPFIRIIRGVVPFIFIMIVCLILFIAFPGLVTWLPQTMTQ